MVNANFRWGSGYIRFLPLRNRSRHCNQSAFRGCLAIAPLESEQSINANNRNGVPRATVCGVLDHQLLSQGHGFCGGPVLVHWARMWCVTTTSFRSVWDLIVSLEGQSFEQIRGQRFTFRCQGDLLHLSTTNQAISRAQMAEAFRLVPLPSTTVVQHLRAPSYIYAILMDPRVRRNDW